MFLSHFLRVGNGYPKIANFRAHGRWGCEAGRGYGCCIGEASAFWQPVPAAFILEGQLAGLPGSNPRFHPPGENRPGRER